MVIESARDSKGRNVPGKLEALAHKPSTPWIPPGRRDRTGSAGYPTLIGNREKY